MRKTTYAPAVALATKNLSTGDGRERHRAAGDEGNKGRASGLLLSLLFALTASFAHEARTASEASPVRLTQTDTAAKVDFNIPEQPLEDALAEWSKQSGLQVLRRDTDNAVELTTPSVTGKLSPAEALEKMLAKSGLRYEFINDRTVRIAPILATATTAVGLGKTSLRLAQNMGNTGNTPSTETGEGRGEVDKGSNDPQENSPESSDKNASESSIQEIVVTAQKRRERLLDVPASVTALSGDQLEKTSPTSLVDLAGYVPGLTVRDGGGPGRTKITLRGIASQEALSSTIGVYIDEIPVGSSTVYTAGSSYSADLLPYDLERLEVLRGPQGTLYGASTMGGLLKYVFKTPRLDSFEGRAGAIVSGIDGSDDVGAGFRAAANIPLIEDRLGIRVSGFRQKTAGYIEDVGRLQRDDSNPYTQTGGRLAGLWKVNDKLSVKFAAMLQDLDGTGKNVEIVDAATRELLYGRFSMSSALDQGIDQTLRLYSLSADLDMGFASFTSASSFEKTRIDDTVDLSGALSGLVDALTGNAYPGNTVPFFVHQSLDKFTQEVRLTSPEAQPFSWMLGGFYTRESTVNLQPLIALDASGQVIPDAGLNPLFSSRAPVTYYEMASFANGTIHLNEKFAVTAGLRYSKSDQTLRVSQYGFFFGTFSPPPPNRTQADEGVVTWMVSPQWHLNRDSMFYARVATGYRPGGRSFLFGTPPFEADRLINYELGYKGVLLDGRLSLDVAAYDIEWDKMQALVTDGITGLSYIGNATTARSRGAEGSVSYNFSVDSNSLRLGATLGYCDARLTGPAPTISGEDGDELGQTPRINGALTIDYQRAFVNRTIEAGVGYRYSGDIWSAPSSNPFAVKTRQAKPVDVYVGLAGDRIETRLFVRNAFNSETSVLSFTDPTSWGVYELVTYQPRTVGLSVDVRF